MFMALNSELTIYNNNRYRISKDACADYIRARNGANYMVVSTLRCETSRCVYYGTRRWRGDAARVGEVGG